MANTLLEVSNAPQVQSVKHLLKEVKFPDSFQIKETRENLETLAKRQGGGMLHVYAVSYEKRALLKDRVVKITHYTLQKCSYEARKEVKELRASGVEADHTVVKNEVEVAPWIWYNTSTENYKIRLPACDVETYHFVDGKFMDAAKYKELVTSLYPPKDKKDKKDKPKILFFSLMLENILCIN